MKRYAGFLAWLAMAVLAGCNGGGSNASEESSNRSEEIAWESLATPVMADGHMIAAPLVDFLPDGRMVIAEGNSSAEIEIAVEKSPGSLTFRYVTSLTPGGTSSFGSFIKVKDADTVLVGASTVIYTVDLQTGACGTLAVIDNFDAALDGNDLYITRSSYNPDWTANSCVTRIDLETPTLPVDVVTGIPGASAGICLDGAGNLYTGNGYGNLGVDETGLIKRFTLSYLPLAWSAGTPCGDVLSAGTLIWAGNGKVLVGGGDTFGSGDDDYFAALDTATGLPVWKMDPDAGADSNYRLSAGAGRFAACVWDYAASTGTIYLTASSGLGL